jgi:plastocyanin
MVGGTEAVTVEQFDEVLKDNRSNSVAGIGVVALALVLYMMVMKPTFGLGGTSVAPPPPPGCSAPTCLQVVASGIQFDTDRLSAPPDTPFRIVFDNEDPDQHNVAIYDGSDPLFKGQIFGGPKTVTYDVPALPAGTYTFVCDVHPTQMKGTFTVEPAAASSSGPASSTTSGG